MCRYFLFAACLLLVFQCKPNPKQDQPVAAPLSDKDGATLAYIYCGSCHVFTEPSLLPRQVWLNKVLPNMATRMGLPMGFPYQKLDVEDMQAVMNAHVIPETPMLQMEEMRRIVAYYAENAPAQALPQERTIQPTSGLPLFKFKKSSLPTISTQNILLKAMPDPSQLVLSFEDKGTYLFRSQTNTYQHFSTIGSSASCVAGNQLYVLNLGKTQAYNLPNGNLWSFQLPDLTQPKVVIEGLIRPVAMDIADVNADGQPDFVVCEFGDYLGRLTLHLSSPQGLQRVILKDYPGACQAYFKDMNNDGLLDIPVLVSQGKEELCLFLNTGKDAPFKEVSIARFPPAYGSNSMEIADMNRDGLLDIIITNGDNADLSYSLKAYHGIRLYQNDGSGKFSLQWFYPMHGASKVVAADFDHDNETDLAVIAHFPEFTAKQPEDFLLFKKTPKVLDFKPMRFTKPFNGRLLTLEQSDMDADGDQDLMIGNFIDQLSDPGAWYADWVKKPSDWWILENTTK